MLFIVFHYIFSFFALFFFFSFVMEKYGQTCVKADKNDFDQRTASKYITSTFFLYGLIKGIIHIHFIHISFMECYYTFNYKDHWDPGRILSQYHRIHHLSEASHVKGLIPMSAKHTVGILPFTNRRPTVAERSRASIL